MVDERLIFNGVDGTSGDYFLPPSREELAELVLKRSARTGRPRALMPGVVPEDLASSGWGVIFSEGADPAIREALEPLLDHRRSLATQKGDFYRELSEDRAYWPGESTAGFLARQGVSAGPVDPKKVPYYLLIVGDPKTIPFRFQHELGVQYAVGRIEFDTPEEYAHYARNVVELETGSETQARRVGFFGVQNPEDRATRHSFEFLTKPLVEAFSRDRADWRIDSWLGEAATKAQLSRVLGGEERPSLLFTSSHGMCFLNHSPRQLRHSGALLCQDWPGPEAWKHRVPEEFYFSGDDVGEGANLRGMISFHFACFGAGVPERDSFGHRAPGAPKTIAPHPFVAGLPRRLLGHPKGALAVIGHVDRAFGFSFYWPEVGSQPAPFEATLTCLMNGEPAGCAMRYFGDRHGQLAAQLTGALELERAGQPPEEIFDLWTATNDAKSYAILGDPAVRLKLEPQG